MAQPAGGDSTKDLLAFLVQSKAKRTELKLEAEKALRHSRCRSLQRPGKLRSTEDLIPQLLKRETSTLAVVAETSRGAVSLSSKIKARLELPIAAMPKRFPTAARTTRRQASPPEERKQQPRLPSLHFYEPNLVLARVYQPRPQALKLLFTRKKTPPRIVTPSPLRSKRCEVMLAPVLGPRTQRTLRTKESRPSLGELAI